MLLYSGVLIIILTMIFELIFRMGLIRGAIMKRLNSELRYNLIFRYVIEGSLQISLYSFINIATVSNLF